jgi:hypothetical protein
MKKINNQSGFGAIEFLLTLIVVILLVFVGWYIYHTDHKSTNSNSYSTQSTSSTTAKTVSYFTITQWGVRAQYSGDLTLEYSTPTGSSPAFVYLSSTQLDKSDNSTSATCSNQQYGGVIQRYSPTDEYTNSDGYPTGNTVAETFKAGTPGFSVVGNYYYIYSPPQGSCSDLATSQTLQTQTVNVFKSLVQSLKVIPSFN